VMDQLDIIESVGGNPKRFISIHTQEEPDFAMHKAVAARGAWIEYDHVGRGDDAAVADMILHALEAGLQSQLLLSHDRGWYDPAKPQGGKPVPYTHLSLVLIPMLEARGVDGATIRAVTHDNPFNAFAR
jgi:phosphotriesterase-related protein